MPGSVAFMVVAIVFISMVGRVLTARYRAIGRTSPGGEVTDSYEAMRSKDEIRQLKERIAVLERVITDNHTTSDLDRQIEQLRDR
jgi:hypothetical protein